MFSRGVGFRCEVEIGMTGGEKPLRCRPMLVYELRLKERSFVRIEPEPMKATEDSVHHLDGRPLNIGVFDPEYEDTVVLASEKPVEQGRTSATEM
jgi:hypothetical protein